MQLPANAGSRGNIGSRGLLGSVLIAAGVVLLIVSPAFLFGEGPAAGSELDAQIAQPAGAPVANGLTLLSPVGDSPLVTVDARLLRVEPVSGSPGSTAPGGPAAALPGPSGSSPSVAVAAIPTPQPAAASAPAVATTAPAPAPSPTTAPPPPPPPTQPPPASPTAVPAPPTQPPSVDLTGFEADILAGVNKERAAAGLAPLQIDSALVMVARERSQDMVRKNYFSHVSPTGDTAFAIMDRDGIPYGWAGENLARNNYPDDESVAVAMRDWMASQGHRENILNIHYATVGIGAAVDGAGMKYFTTVFTGP